MIPVREFRYYSPVHDANMVRVSAYDEHGGEFFALVPAEGRGYRERRNAAAQAIERAIDNGRDPGEVVVQPLKPINGSAHA